MYAYVPNGSEVGFKPTTIKNHPPTNRGCAHPISGELVSLFDISEEGRLEFLATLGWHLVEESEDPGETATETRDTSVEVTQVDPVVVSRLFTIRPKTQEEIDQETEETETNERRARLLSIKAALEARSEQHNTWATQAANLNGITEANRDAVIMGLVNRQAQADIWFSQLYLRLIDLIRFIGIR